MVHTKQSAVTLTWEHLSEIVLFGKEHGFTDMTLNQLLELREVSKAYETFASYREANPIGSAKAIERIRSGAPHRRGLVLKILRDEDASNPRGIMDTLGTMACAHRRYDLGDVKSLASLEECEQGIPEGSIKLPLFLLDHSGITMRASPFDCKWDSAQVGYIYATPEAIAKEYPATTLTRPALELEVRLRLDQEVETYDAYLRGDVWGFVLENEDGEHIDSCWGFYGDDKDGIREHLEDDARALLDAAWDKRGG